MTKTEFESRVKMPVSYVEYKSIEIVYLNSDVDKDEFCRLWSKMNRERIKEYNEELKKKKEKLQLENALFKIHERYKYKSFDWKERTFAAMVFTENEIKTLGKAGLKVGNAYSMFRVSSVLSDIINYIQNKF